MQGSENGRVVTIGRGSDRMVVGFMQSMPTTTSVVSSNPASGEVYSIQHIVKIVVSDLQQVGRFLRVLRFTPPIKLTDTI